MSVLEDSPARGELWKHVKSGNVYVVIGGVKVEYPDESWHDHVYYMRLEGTPERYSRSLKRFKERFEPIMDGREKADLEGLREKQVLRLARDRGEWEEYLGDSR